MNAERPVKIRTPAVLRSGPRTSTHSSDIVLMQTDCDSPKGPFTFIAVAQHGDNIYNIRATSFTTQTVQDIAIGLSI